MVSQQGVRKLKRLSRNLAVTALLVTLCIGLSAALAEARVMPKTSPQEKIEGRYIVVLRQSVADPATAANRLSKRHRFHLRHVYRRALRGFAAQIPEAIVPILKRDSNVAFIEPDRVVYALNQTLPSGVDRIQSDQNDTHKNNPVDVDIAIIDTGIDLDHPDLNVVSAINCANWFGGCADGGDDGHGHGSHVAANGRATDAAGVYRIRQALIDGGIDQDSADGLADNNDPDSNWENIGWAEDSKPLQNDLAVMAISAPKTVVAGEEIDIMTTLKTMGTTDTGRFAVVLTDGIGGPELGRADIDGLPAGESTEQVFTWRPGETDIGNHTLVAFHDFSDDNRTNDSKSASVEVISGDAPTSLHVTDLDGIGSTTDWWFVWRATVDIQVRDNLNQPVAEAEVDIDWSDGSEDSCTTDSSGMCQITGFQWIWTGSIGLSVVDVYHQDLTYDPTANEDPDGDSNGTTITINRP